MSDNDDWIGTPPEDRDTRDRAKPEFWQQYGWVLGISGGIRLIGIIVVLLAGV
jgi:hypothetical protein